MTRPPRAQVTDVAIAHKAQVHDALEDYEERAAIREYLGGMSRAAAERAAVSDVEAMLQRKARR